MVVLHQPNWRKFLSLRGESKVLGEHGGQNGDEISSPQTNPSSNSAAVADLTSTKKKRKRSDEEIALRKAKKLKSKSKENQEFKLLTDGHQTQLSKSNDDGSGMNELVAETDVKKAPPENMATSDDKPNVTLLAAKAKEIAKARRVEKLQESQKPKSKNDQQSSSIDAKANQVLEYLDQYRSHIESGSVWKFKKKNQNWILKHLYSFPWKSDDLVVMYLKAVEGQARNRLVEEAKEVIAGKDEADDEALIQRAKKILQALEG
jgi:hypothetical protein